MLLPFFGVWGSRIIFDNWVEEGNVGWSVLSGSLGIVLSVIYVDSIIDFLSIVVGHGVILGVCDVFRLSFFVFVSNVTENQRGQLCNAW